MNSFAVAGWRSAESQAGKLRKHGHTRKCKVSLLILGQLLQQKIKNLQKTLRYLLF